MRIRQGNAEDSPHNKASDDGRLFAPAVETQTCSLQQGARPTERFEQIFGRRMGRARVDQL